MIFQRQTLLHTKADFRVQERFLCAESVWITRIKFLIWLYPLPKSIIIDHRKNSIAFAR